VNESMEVGTGRVERLKILSGFDQWRGTNRLEENLLVWRLFLAGTELQGWRPERIRRSDLPGWPPSLRSNWVSSDWEGALLHVATFECADRETAHEFLVRTLAEFQSTAVARDDEVGVGDIAFTVPGHTVLLFARANLTVLMRNGGVEVVPVVEPAEQLDRWIANRPEVGGPVIPEISRFQVGRRDVRAGTEIPVDVEAVDPLARSIWFKFYSRTGEVRLEAERPVYRAFAPGEDEVTMFALNENRGAASRTVTVRVTPADQAR
jgi:hypothetical protein